MDNGNGIAHAVIGLVVRVDIDGVVGHHGSQFELIGVVLEALLICNVVQFGHRYNPPPAPEHGEGRGGTVVDRHRRERLREIRVVTLHHKHVGSLICVGLPIGLALEVETLGRILVVDLLGARRPVRLHDGHAVGVKPDLIVVDLTQKAVHDGQFVGSELPFMVNSQRGVGGRRQDVFNARAQEDFSYGGHVVGAGGEVERRLQFVLLEDQTAVIRLNADRLRPVFIHRALWRGREKNAAWVLHAVDNLHRHQLIAEEVGLVVRVDHAGHGGFDGGFRVAVDRWGRGGRQGSHPSAAPQYVDSDGVGADHSSTSSQVTGVMVRL